MLPVMRKPDVRNLIVVLTLLASLSACGALEGLLADALNDYAFEGITEAVMDGDSSQSTTISASDGDASPSDAQIEHYAIATEEDVPPEIVAPAYENLEEAAEALFSDEDLALLNSVDATSVAAQYAVASLPRIDSFHEKFWTYYHVPNQAADFAFPLERDMKGGWILSRIVIDGVDFTANTDLNRSLPPSPFPVDIGFRVFVDLLDGTGDLSPRDSAAGWPSPRFDEALEDSLERGFPAATAYASAWRAPFLARCSGDSYFDSERCVLKPNTSDGTLTIPLNLYNQDQDRAEKILREGETPNGLMLFVRTSSDIASGYWNSEGGGDVLGLPFFTSRDTTIRFDWRIEDFTYVTDD